MVWLGGAVWPPVKPGIDLKCEAETATRRSENIHGTVRSPLATCFVVHVANNGVQLDNPCGWPAYAPVPTVSNVAPAPVDEFVAPRPPVLLRQSLSA